MTKQFTSTEIHGFLGIATDLTVSESSLNEAVDIIRDLVNGTYRVDLLRNDIDNWNKHFTVINDPDNPQPPPGIEELQKERPAPMPPMSPFGN